MTSDPNTNIPINQDEGTSEKRSLIDKNGKSALYASGRRWLILCLGSNVAFVNGFQNLQFAGCEVQVVKYFQTTFLLGDLLTQAYYVSLVILAFPVIWLIMRCGLRFTVRCAAVLALIAATMTAVSTIHRHLYVLALASEFIAGTAQVFILCYPSLLAGAWFPAKEVSTASGTIVFFYQLGNGLALLVPPLVVKEADLETTMGLGAVVMFSSLAVFALLIYILVKVCFADDPPYQIGNNPATCSYRISLINLLSNRDFVLLVFSYGIDLGIFGAETSLFKSVLSDNFPDISDVTTGQIVAFMILVGTVAPIVFGIVLDKTKKFVWTLLFIHVICIASTIILVFAMRRRMMWLVWFGSALFGVGFTGKMSVGLETAAEITHPVPEGASSGFLMWSMSIFTTIFIQLVRFILEASNTYANVFIACCSVSSFIFTCFMGENRRRSGAVYDEVKDAAEAVR